jgi:hypothetical protein
VVRLIQSTSKLLLALTLIGAGLFGVLDGGTAQASPGNTGNTINFQGRLLTNSGAVVADGTYNMEFKLYKNGPGNVAGDTGGTLLWTEDWVYGTGSPDNRVVVKNGYYSVNLGSITPLPSAATLDESVLWLSMNIENTAGATAQCTGFASSSPAACTGGDGEMLPMKTIGSTPYAINAANANQVNSYGLSNNFLNLAAPSGISAVNGAAGSVPGTVCYAVTATNSSGETIAANNSGTVTPGGTHMVTVSWSQVSGATGYKIYRNSSCSFTSGSLLLTTISSGSTVSYSDNATSTSAGLPPTTVTGSTVDLQAWNSQTANLLQLQNSAATTIARVDSNGNVYVNALDTQTGTALNIAQTSGGTATSINLNQSTTVASGSAFTVTSGLTTLKGATGGSANALLVNTNATTNTGEIIQGVASQSADLLDVEDSTGAILSSLGSTGQLTLGRSAASGTTLTGTIKVVYGGNTSGFGDTLSVASLTGSHTITLPDAAGNVCLDSGNCSGTSGGYILNRASSAQSANFNIQSTATTNVGGVIQGATSQTADLFDLRDSTGANLLTVSAAGNQELGGYQDVSGMGGFGSFGNLILQSEALDQTGEWTVPGAGIAVTANSVAAPDSTTTAEKLASSASGTHSIIQTCTTGCTTNSATYTYSIWVRADAANNPTNVQLRIDWNNGSGQTGTAATFSATTTWQRFSVTQTVSASGMVSVTPTLLISSNSVTVYAWGAQLNLGTTPGVYAQSVLSQIIAGQGTVVNGYLTVVSPNGAISRIDGYGNMSLAGQLTTGDQATLNTYNTSDSALDAVQVGTGFTVPTAIINGGTTPGAGADLLQLQSNGTPVARFNNAGNLYVASTIDTQGSGALTVGNGSTTTTLNLGSVGSTTKGTAVHINDTSDATNTQTVTLGSSAANTNDVTTIQGGSSTTGAILVTPNAAGAIVVGAATGTGALTLGQSTQTQSIFIGNAAVASGKTQTITIGSGATSGNGVDTVAVGDINNGSSLALYGGTNGVTVQAAATGTIALGTTNANSLQLGAQGSAANADTVTVGTSTGAAQTIEVGGTGATSASNASTTVTLQAGQTDLALANAGATLQKFMSATVTHVTGGDWNANGTPINTLTISPHTVGNLVMLGIDASAFTAKVGSVSGGGVSNWHYVTQYNDSGNGLHMEIWEGVVTTTGSQTVTATFSTPQGSVFTELVANEFTAGLGASTNWTVTGSNTNQSTSTGTPVFPSLTPASSGEAYWGYMDGSGSSGAGSTSGFSYYPTTFNNLTTYDPNLTGGTPYQPGAVETVNTNYADSVAAVIGATTGNTLTVTGPASVGVDSSTALTVQNGVGATLLDANTAAGTVAVTGNGNTSNTLQVNNSDGESVFQTGTSQNADGITNYITDSEFGLGSGNCPLTDWSVVGSPTSCAQNTTTASSVGADTSLKLVTTSSANQGVQTSVFTSPPPTASSGTGEYYTVSFYAMQTSGPPLAASNWEVVATGGGGPTATNCTSAGQAGNTLNATGFERVVCTLTFTSATGISNIAIETTGSNLTADTVYLSDVQLQQAATSAGTLSAFQIGQLNLRGVITSPVAMQNNANSSAALQVQNAAGNTIFNINTNNTDINTSTASTTGVSSSSPTNVNAVLQSTYAGTPGATTSTLGVAPHAKGDLMLLTIAIANNATTVSSIGATDNGGVSNWVLVQSKNYATWTNGTYTGATVYMYEGTVTSTGCGAVCSNITVTYSASDSVSTEIINNEFSSGLGTSTTWGVTASGNATADSTGITAGGSTIYPVSFSTLTSGTTGGGLYYGYSFMSAATRVDPGTPGFHFLSTPIDGNVVGYSTNLAPNTSYAPVQLASAASYYDSVGAILTPTVDNSVGINGSTLVTGAASAAAFQVQNSVGAADLNVDTANNVIGLLGGNTGDITPWQYLGDTTGNNTGIGDNTAVTANGYVFDVTGYDGSGGVDGNIYYTKASANGPLGHMSSEANIPATHLEYQGAVVANGYLYEVGGSGNGTTTSTAVQYAQINNDGTLGTWQTTTVLPQALGLAGASVVAANGYIYVLGGWYNNGGTATMSTAVYYGKVNADGTISSWTTSANSEPTALRYASAVYVNGNILLIGGVPGTSGNAASTVYSMSVSATTGANGTICATACTNNFANASLPANRAYTTAYVENGYVYVVGGSTEDTTTGYNIQSTTYYGQVNSAGYISSWNTSAQQLPQTTMWQGGVALNGYLYVIGGIYLSGPTYSPSMFYTSTARIVANASLDLVGSTSADLADGGDQSSGSEGGSLTAGNTNIVGSLQVANSADFDQGVAVDGNLTNFGLALFKSASNSANALQVQNSSGSTLLNLDTTNTKVTIATTANGGELIDDGSTLDSAKNLGNLSTGAIGTAPATVDIYTSFVIPQTTASVSVTVPTPTDTTAGRIIFIANTGTVPMTVAGVTLSNGSSMELFWTGSGGAWTTTAVSTGVSIIGTFSGSSQVNGASISGNTLTFGPADATNPGMVTTGTQTFAGAKTLSSTLTIGTGSTGESTAVELVLDNQTAATDPAGVTGAMYFNQTLNEYRCYASSGWRPCTTPAIDAGYEVDDDFMTGATASGACGVGEANWCIDSVSTADTISYAGDGTLIGSGVNPGILTESTPASASRGSLVHLSPVGVFSNSGLAVGQDWKASAAVSSVANPGAIFRIGVLASVNLGITRPNDGVWWEFDPVANATHWEYCYGTGSASTCAPYTSITVSANTLYRLEAQIVSSSAVNFYINGTKIPLTGLTLGLATSVPEINCLNDSTFSTGGDDCMTDYFQFRGDETSLR